MKEKNKKVGCDGKDWTKRDDLKFLLDPNYADEICKHAYEEDKEYIDEVIKWLAKR